MSIAASSRNSVLATAPAIARAHGFHRSPGHIAWNKARVEATAKRRAEVAVRVKQRRERLAVRSVHELGPKA